MLLIIGLALFLLLLFLICPTLRNHPDRTLLNNMYIAHRGFHTSDSEVPENSLSSFKKAIENGYDIEIDIHVTKDGKVAVFHDDTLKRMCGKNIAIETLSSIELKKFRLLESNETIPMLEDVLTLVDGKVCLVIEYKCDAKNYERLCVAADKVLKNYIGKYIVQSFNPLAMMWFKNNRPEILRGQLSTNFTKQKNNSLLRTLIGLLLLNFLSRPDFISYDIKYTNAVQRRICICLGAASVGWTFKSQESLDKYKNKYSAYIFEKFIPKRP